jgi:hypothetical protein
MVLCVLPPAGPEDYYPAWPDLRKIVTQLLSPEGAAQLFQSQPRLADRYGEERHFIDLATKWCDRLIALPANLDDLDPDRTTVEMQGGRGSAVAYFTFHNLEPAGSLTFLKLTWEGKSLVKADFYRGFVRVTPVDESAQGLSLPRIRAVPGRKP